MEDTKRAASCGRQTRETLRGRKKRAASCGEAALLLTNLSIDEDFTLQRLAITTATTIVLPDFTAVTSPSLLMVAMLLSSVLHWTGNRAVHRHGNNRVAHAH